MKIILLIMIGLSLLQADYIRDDSKEVVIDTTTNLMWQDDNATTSSTYTWSTAIIQCESLSLGGFSDWRLPSFNELNLLADRSIFNPSLSPIFSNVVSSRYWSSTTNALITTLAWIVFFSNGNGNAYAKTNTYYVRCVR